MGRYAPLSLNDFLTDIYIPRRLRAGSSLTFEAYRQTYRQLQAFWRSRKPDERRALTMTVGDLDEDLIAQFLVSRKNASISTQNKDLRHIRLLWNFAEEQGEPLGKLRLKQEKEYLREPEYWAPQELTQVIVAAADEKGYVGDVPAHCWWPALILTVYATGARINAVMNIRSASLDLQQGRLKLSAESQKQKADQWVQLIPEAIVALTAMRPERNERLFDDWPHDRTDFQRKRRSWRTLGRHYKLILRRTDCRIDGSKCSTSCARRSARKSRASPESRRLNPCWGTVRNASRGATSTSVSSIRRMPPRCCDVP